MIIIIINIVNSCYGEIKNGMFKDASKKPNLILLLDKGSNSSSKIKQN